MVDGVIMRAVREEARKEVARQMSRLGLKVGRRGRPQSIAVLVREELKGLGVHIAPDRRKLGGTY